MFNYEKDDYIIHKNELQNHNYQNDQHFIEKAKTITNVNILLPSV